MQAPRPRNTHTPVAIKKARHTPAVNLHPEPFHTAAGNPLGVYRDAPIYLAYPAYPAYSAYASITPPQHAHRRSHQVARCITPAVNLRPEPNHTTHRTPGISPPY